MKENGAQVVAGRRKKKYFRAHLFVVPAANSFFYVTHKSLNRESGEKKIEEEKRNRKENRSFI